jgi:tetratricopeptide (TPR) repeat protein
VTSEAAPSRPDLPWDDEPVLPHGVRKEIDRVLGTGPRANDVALALSVGAAAIDEGLVDVAVEALAWAKDKAGRIAAIREAYGVALYLAERYGEALVELQAYRRMTGHNDQNHLIADSLRALDRGLDRVAAAARELVEDERAPADRRAEATLVWAGAIADTGEVRTARVLVRRALESAADDGAEHVLRLRLFAAELAGRDGDADERRAQLRAVAAIDPEFLAAADLEGPAGG